MDLGFDFKIDIAIYIASSYLSKKNEIKQADNFKDRFCLLELGFDGIMHQSDYPLESIDILF